MLIFVSDLLQPPIISPHPAPPSYSPTLYPHFLISNSNFTFYLQQIISLKKKDKLGRPFSTQEPEAMDSQVQIQLYYKGSSKTSQGNLVILCLEKKKLKSDMYF